MITELNFKQRSLLFANLASIAYLDEKEATAEEHVDGFQRGSAPTSLSQRAKRRRLSWLAPKRALS